MASGATAENPRHKRNPGMLIPQKSEEISTPAKTVNPTPAGESEEDEEGEDGVRAEERTTRTSRELATPETGCNHSLEAFLQISSNGRPQIAPKGGVYFVSDLREVPQLFFLKAPNLWPEQITSFADGVKYYQLSPDGEKILVATDQGGDEQYNIYLLEPAKKKIEPLLVDRATRVESLQWGPGSDWFAYTANTRNKTDMDLYRFELKGKKSQLLTELTGLNSVSDISRDGSLIAISTYRSITDSDVNIWEAGKPIKTMPFKVGDESVVTDGKFSADGKGIFFLSDREKGIHQLYFAPLDGSKPPKAMTSGPWATEVFVMDNLKKAILYGTNEEGYSRMAGFAIDAKGARTKTLLTPKLYKEMIGTPAIAYVQGRETIFFAKTSSTESSDIWQWNHPKQTQWTQSSKGLITKECFSTEELIHYPTFDGKQIPAFLYKPKNATGPVPYILYLHGGPEAQFRPSFSRIFQYLLQRGFGILAPNVRGSTGYGKEYTQLDNYKKRMDSVRDGIEGAKWLLAKRYTVPGKLAINGGSYGGFMVLRSIQVEPELFSAASESVGIANFVTFLKNTKPYRRAAREVEYGPLSDETFLKSISPMTYLDQIKTPLLIFHGANDPRVPLSETEQVIDQLKKRSVTAEVKIFADEGHGNTKLRNIMEQAKLMVYFFEKNLKK